MDHKESIRLNQIIDHLYGMITSSSPSKLPDELAGYETLRKLNSDLMEIRKIISDFSHGNFSRQIKIKGYLAGSLKTLQANLNHLDWQTQRVASGDFSQRVDFMGGFSDAFNSMVIQLEETIQKHKNRGQKLAATTRELKKHSDHLEDLVKERTLKIKKNEKKFRELADMLPMAVFEMDMAGKITYANELGFEYTGYTREEYEAGVNVFQFVAPEDHGRIEQQFLRMLEGEENKPYEYTLIKKNGTRFPFMIYSSLIGNEGQPIGLRGAIVDISDIKQSEKKLIEAKEAAQAANKAKSEFFANMSHELRTPMNAIKGMTHLCLQTELNGQQKDYLQKLDNAGRSLMEMINNLLDFSRIEEGDLEMKPRAFGVRGFLENLKTTFLPVARKKLLDFDISVSPEVPAVLACDDRRLNQILSHLLDNAVKFTEKGGVALRVRAEGIEHGDWSGITGEKSGIDPTFKIQHSTFRITFEVEDTGIGMTQDQLEQIFQPFLQLDGSSTRKYGGTGFGLSFSKRLVNMMGGTIRVESEKGKGSTFYFTAVFETVSEDVREEVEEADARDIEAPELPLETARVEADTTEPLDLSILAPKLAELSDLIKDDDTRAMRKFSEIKDDLGILAIRGDVTILEKALGEYDFEDALAALTRIKDKVGIRE